MKRFLYVFILFLITSCGADDPATLIISPPENPALKVTNNVAVTTDANSFLGVDDVLTYTISIKNLGNVILNTVNLTYSLIDNDGTSLTLSSPISFVSSDANSSNGTLAVDETATYTTTYTIMQSDVDAGGISNSITANATSPDGTIVSDISDNGDDTDGNDSNDPTETSIEFDPLIISEYHEFYTIGDIKTKYHFNDDGVLYKYTDINADLSVIFEFDTEGRITFIKETDLLGTVLNTHEITYDTHDRVTSIGDHNYIYNTDEEYYYDEDSYFEVNYESGDLIYTEISYLKFFNSEIAANMITQQCNFTHNYTYNTVTEVYTEDYIFCNIDFGAFFIDHDGMNVTFEPSVDNIYYYYFTSNNPLYTNSINLDTLYIFLYKLNILNNNFNFKRLLSQNNLQSWELQSGPESSQWFYNFNDLYLPIDSTKHYYYFGAPDGEYLFANYYYQGDEIPD